jgi:dienelactone hydrolase
MSEDCCVSGHVHAHLPGGALETIGGRSAYFSRPVAPSTRAVIILPDVFGHELPNTRRLADGFAEAGFLCVVPDIFDGDALPPDALNGGRTPAVVEWFGRHSDVTEVLRFVLVVAAELREKHGILKVAAQGYCFGGRFAVLAAATQSIDAFAAAHPSRVVLPTEVAAVIKVCGKCTCLFSLTSLQYTASVVCVRFCSPEYFF